MTLGPEGNQQTTTVEKPGGEEFQKKKLLQVFSAMEQSNEKRGLESTLSLMRKTRTCSSISKYLPRPQPMSGHALDPGIEWHPSVARA